MAMATADELKAMLNSVEENASHARRSPERVTHRVRGSIIDPRGDGLQMSREVVETFSKVLREGAN
jgi:hypothetical protein